MRSELPADNTRPFRAEQVEQFERDGYLMVESLFDTEEVALMLRVAQDDRLLHEHAYGRKDAQGRQSRLSLWNAAATQRVAAAGSPTAIHHALAADRSSGMNRGLTLSAVSPRSISLPRNRGSLAASPQTETVRPVARAAATIARKSDQKTG